MASLFRTTATALIVAVNCGVVPYATAQFLFSSPPDPSGYEMPSVAWALVAIATAAVAFVQVFGLTLWISWKSPRPVLIQGLAVVSTVGPLAVAAVLLYHSP